MNTLIQSYTYIAEFNGIAAGTYEWHRTEAAAEQVALPGTAVKRSSPGIWRARVA
jgi:hypothetical protein